MSISLATEHVNSFEHPSKALEAILVTESGIVTEVKAEHCLKAPVPILVTESPIVTEVKPEHRQKALSPILVTASPSTTVFTVFLALGNVVLITKAREVL